MAGRSGGGHRSHYGAGTVVRKGNRWQGRFYVNGKPVKRSLGLRREVDPKGLTEAQARKKLRELQTSYKLPNPEGKTPFQEVAAAFLNHQEAMGLADESVYAYRKCVGKWLNPEFKDRAIADITPADVKQLQEKMLKKVAKRSVRAYMSILSGVFNYAAAPENGKMIDSNPCAVVKRPKIDAETEIRVLFSAELQKLYAAIPNDEMGKVEKVLYPFSARTGLRRGESGRLRWRHLDFEGRGVRVLGKTKNRKGRTVPMSMDVKAMLLEWREETIWNKADDLVFANPKTGKSFESSAILKRFQKAILRADVGEFDYEREREGEVKKWPLTVFHDLRHSFATTCAMAGVPLPTLKVWMGHSRIQTTMIYAHYMPTEREADLLDKAFGNAPTEIVPRPSPTLPAGAENLAS